MDEKFCVVCGASLKPRTIKRGAVCCCASCAAKNRPSRARPCVCAYCGKEFIGGSAKAKFCCHACGEKYRRRARKPRPPSGEIEKKAQEAQKRGLSYGQLQALKYLEQQKSKV